MQKIKLSKEPKLDAKLKAFSFQAEVVKEIRDLEYAAIFHEPGLGKSKIAIDLILYWLEHKFVDTILYITKKSLISNCKKEFATHTYIKPAVLSQNRVENYYTFNSPERLILTHYEVLKSENETLQLFLKTRVVAVILDESTKIKNPESEITQAVFKLAPLFSKRIIMTGTPVANRPYDIWAQIYFLDQGKHLGEDFAKFKRESDLSNDLYEHKDKQLSFESFIENVFSHISDFSVRETKDSGVIHLPEKMIESIISDWEPIQYDLYVQVQKEMRAVVLRDGIPTEDNSEEVLKRLLRLVQIASNPHLIDESYTQEPGKLEILRNIISIIRNNSEKCIVWSSFVYNIDWLSKELEKFGVCKVHGKMDMDTRNKSIEKFINEEDIGVLIATPGAAKEGLTLTVANHVIFYDRNFSLDDYLQAQDRIHRISQIKKCFVHNLIMKDSIDEWVDVLLQAKHLAAQLAQGDISLDYYRSQISYDFGEIISGILNIGSFTK